MKIIFCLLIFCIIVISHELGHFIVAKANGIVVKQFFIGFGPTIASFKKGGTEYCIKPIPLGGACVFDADDPEHFEESTFLKANVYARIATILAGPLFNFILAFILALFVVGYTGYPTTKLLAVTPDSPAMEAGLEPGDEIIKVNRERVHMYSEVALESRFNNGETTTFTVLRNGEKKIFTVTPKYDEEYGRYFYGFTGGDYDEEFSPLKTIQYSYYYVMFQIKTTYKSLAWLITGRISTDAMTGPVGVAKIVGDTYESAKSSGALIVILSMLDIAILLSANLGVVNLLPFPALDGGRLVFMIIEAVRGKPVSPEKEGYVHFIGMALLIFLMAYVLFKDIVRLI